MAGRSYVQPVSLEHLDALELIDREYAERYGLAPVLSRGSLIFYSRSGHSFVSLEADKVTGFVLAQAIWNGVRPQVFALRLATTELANASYDVLLEALTKSAYDAAVYDLSILQVRHDTVARAALNARQYQEQDITLYSRTLGSRGNQKGE